MLTTINSAFSSIFASIKINFSFLITLLAVLWSIQIINLLLRYRLNIFGIYPRKILSLPGIFISPFLHGSNKHLFFNSIPLVVLSALILVEGKAHFFTVSLIIIALSGLVLWLAGRPAFHVGASGVIMGYWGYLLFNAYQQRSVMTVLLALLCLYYFGSLFLSLFPTEERVSWEGHVFGFVSGLVASYLISHHFFG